MNPVIKAAIVTVAVLLPAAAFAQSNEPLTRGQVRAELLQLEDAGYNPLSNCTGDCPGSLRRAEALLARRQQNASASYGPGTGGTEQSGR
ncbi:DUF4148 domain-containing protein [Burkholderia sp. Ac-20365]|uniref:DUF4148 domain-containing protein n=1 Tax=Burkholderia sp. Ac-20365 TaxID=2703897 RepID=UPI00197BB9CC|nr:DUF4148 domain-containing protein [Burkholderia sp. Ac-20365]MBN3760796.1 DUF4148 domain-containing protein [Burkholderia sp. Ac-20365]